MIHSLNHKDASPQTNHANYNVPPVPEPLLYSSLFTLPEHTNRKTCGCILTSVVITRDKLDCLANALPAA